jgi:hypothetical protein
MEQGAWSMVQGKMSQMSKSKKAKAKEERGSKFKV